ncbi:prolactin-releasing peptide [Sapajus apella]|uniref:Prolactin-releasing peptide n=1 Tax=Sapajus apella TaxID=9515 RepID=A0A6J3HT82_SAPAP|nr:prolactin-releasing peptide [Sapajus apella]
MSPFEGDRLVWGRAPGGTGFILFRSYKRGTVAPVSSAPLHRQPHSASASTTLESGRVLPLWIPPPAGPPGRSQGMKILRAWLLCLLMLGLALRGAADQTHRHSMETRNPDVNPAWYTSRRIRPVGRFGRRRAALGDVSKSGLQPQLTCFPLEGGAKSSQDGR